MIHISCVIHNSYSTVSTASQYLACCALTCSLICLKTLAVLSSTLSVERLRKSRPIFTIYQLVFQLFIKWCCQLQSWPETLMKTSLLANSSIFTLMFINIQCPWEINRIKKKYWGLHLSRGWWITRDNYWNTSTYYNNKRPKWVHLQSHILYSFYCCYVSRSHSVVWLLSWLQQSSNRNLDLSRSSYGF